MGSKMPRPKTAFELKGTMALLTVLRLQTVDLMQIERQLRAKLAQRPQMFHYAPVLLDLGQLEQPGSLAIAALVSLMRSFRLVPVGAINGPDSLAAALAGAGLGLLPSSPSAPKARGSETAAASTGDDLVAERRPEAPAAAARVPASTIPLSGPVAPSPVEPARTPPPAPAARPAAAVTPAPTPTPTPAPMAALPRAPHAGPMVVTQPVRSGQVVYAKNNDLVVLAPVNAGAQVMADGHVHIYNTLRGRAIAGAQGLPGARIFVQKLEAELVAIADAYIMAEEMPAKSRGQAVQVYLDGNECRIAPL